MKLDEDVKVSNVWYYSK